MMIDIALLAFAFAGIGYGIELYRTIRKNERLEKRQERLEKRVNAASWRIEDLAADIHHIDAYLCDLSQFIHPEDQGPDTGEHPKAS